MHNLTTEEKEFVWEVDNETTRKLKAAGKVEGRIEALHAMARRLFTRRFGLFPDDFSEKIGLLSPARLEDLLELTHDFASLDDAKAWIEKSAN
jgi:hypothetical protein